MPYSVTLSNLDVSISTVVTERVLYWREHSAGAYSEASYFLSKLIVDIVPFRILPAITFSCVSYFIVGFQGDLGHFAMFTFTLVLSNMVAGASIFAISTACANVRTASLVGVVYFLFNIVFGGPFLSQARNAPSSGSDGRSTPVSSYLSLFSFFYYAFEVCAHLAIHIVFHINFSY